MNIGKISNPITKTLAVGMLLGVAIKCNNTRNEYVDTLKNSVKETVDPQVYKYYENKAAQFGASEEKVFQNAYDSIQFAHRNYFEGMQSASGLEE